MSASVLSRFDLNDSCLISRLFEQRLVVSAAAVIRQQAQNKSLQIHGETVYPFEAAFTTDSRATLF